MKAILVIDIPSFNKNIEDYFVNYTLFDRSIKHQEKRIGFDFWCPLHLIPEKYKLNRGYERYEKFSEVKAYAEGWNDCIDELLGENKEEK